MFLFKPLFIHFCQNLCSDRADPFFIEKGRPAEREAGEGEISGSNDRSIVYVIGNK